MKAMLSCRNGISLAVKSLSSTSSLDTSQLKPFEQIPGPRSLPILKSLWAFLPLIGQYRDARELQKDYGDMVKLEISSMRAVIVFDPYLIQKILAQEGKFPIRPGLHALAFYKQQKPEIYPTKGVFFGRGETWKDLRLKIQKHVLKPTAVRTYLEPMSNVADDFTKKIKRVRDSNMEVDNFLNELFKWALESIGIFSLSRRLGCLEDNLPTDSEPQKVIEAVVTTFNALYKLEKSFRLYRFFPMPTYKKMERAQTYFESVVLKYITETAESLKNGAIPTDNILNALLLDSTLNIKEVSHFLLDAYFAAVDTTAITSGFLLYELARNPDKQEKLYQELLSVLPDKNEAISSEQYDKLSYMKACIKESLRLNPTVASIGREIDHDFALNGYHIPANTKFGLMNVHSSYNEKYFKNASKFIPERWLESEVGRDQLPFGFANIPFGVGPRMCIGRRIAEQEIHLLVSRILQSFRLEYHQASIGHKMGTVTHPDKPFRIEFHDRN